MRRGEIYLLIDFECPICNKKQAFSNCAINNQGKSCCVSCGYTFPKVFVDDSNLIKVKK
jgi:transcription elongation factor Elf1